MEGEVIQRIRGYLRTNDLSVSKLASMLKMNSSTLSGKINGNRGLDLETVCSILELFPDLSAEWLLRGNSSPTISGSIDTELQETCIEQAKEIMRLKKRIAELEHNL